MGADGELVGDDEHVVVRAATSEEISFADGMSRDSSHSEWYAPLMRDFVERVRRQDSSSGPLDEALYVTRLITCAYESSEERRAIPFEAGALTPVQVGPALSAMTDAVSRVVEPESETGPAGGETEAVEPPPVQTARRTPWLVRAAGIAMLAVAGWWAVHDVDWANMPAALANVSPPWIASPRSSTCWRCTRWPRAGARCSARWRRSSPRRRPSRRC